MYYTIDKSDWSLISKRAWEQFDNTQKLYTDSDGRELRFYTYAAPGWGNRD